MCVNCSPGRRGFAKMILGLAASGLAGAAPAFASKKLPFVMIDPGHGGHDPGALAPDGTFEKDITLATGLTLRRSLLATGRYRVEMTRSRDVFVTLDGRVADSVAAGANLFLALHCDPLPEPQLRGASVFTLSDKASDGLAAGLANDENSADRGAAGLHGVSPQVAGIL